MTIYHRIHVFQLPCCSLRRGAPNISDNTYTMSQPEQQRIQFILTLTENPESRVTRGQLPELDLVRQDIARSEYAICMARH